MYPARDCAGKGGRLDLLCSRCCRQSEKRLPDHIQIGCVTFGSPLVGSEDIEDTVRERGWCSSFLHLVGRQDVVPRLLLAKSQGVAAGICGWNFCCSMASWLEGLLESLIVTLRNAAVLCLNCLLISSCVMYLLQEVHGRTQDPRMLPPVLDFESAHLLLRRACQLDCSGPAGETAAQLIASTGASWHGRPLLPACRLNTLLRALHACAGMARLVRGVVSTQTPEHKALEASRYPHQPPAGFSDQPLHIIARVRPGSGLLSSIESPSTHAYACD